MTEASSITSVLSTALRMKMDTPFHIDFDWWEHQRREYVFYMRSHLCEEHQYKFVSEEDDDDQMLDWVDSRTGQVCRLDYLHYTLRIHCAIQPEFLTKRTSLVDAIFRLFIANGNQPLTVTELALRIGREGQEKTIFRTLADESLSKGLRPVQSDSGTNV